MARPVTPLLTVDCVVFDRNSRLLLIRRRFPPFEGHYALPGGFVDIGETVEDACRREVLEETGLKIGKVTLVGVYSAPDRDPRGHTCSAAFVASSRSTRLMAGDDAASAEWVDNWRGEKLAFDHRKIVRDAQRRISSGK